MPNSEDHTTAAAADITRGLVPTSTDAAAIIDAAERASTPKPLDPSRDHVVVVPEGHKVVPFAADENPRGLNGIYRALTVDGFVSYVDAFEDAKTTVWVHPTSGAIEAVINDNAPDRPDWGDHRMSLQLETTPEWDLWLRGSGSLMDQENFAEHIERGIRELVNPDGAHMLEIAQSIQATTEAQFRSAKRLDNGQVQLQYDEQIDATAGASGEFEIPREFELAIAPFVGEDPYKVTARLRYRLKAGTLKIGYELDRPADVVRDAIERITERLTEAFDRVYVGTAANARR